MKEKGYVPSSTEVIIISVLMFGAGVLTLALHLS